jgi:hypothetical protein
MQTVHMERDVRGYIRDSQYLQVKPKTLRLPEPQPGRTPTRAAAEAATRAQTEQVSDLTHGAPPARSRHALYSCCV